LIVMLPSSAQGELLEADMLVRRYMYKQLTGMGYKAVMLNADDYRDLMADEALAGVRHVDDLVTGTLSRASHDRALAAVARRVAQDTGAALVMQPRFTLRMVPIKGKDVAVWDGQRRAVITREGGAFKRSYTGVIGALSIRLDAFSPNGLLGFRTHGGASLMFNMNLETLRQERNPDLLKAEYLEEAVDIVLAPLQSSAARQGV
jgi:hypothetical protein